MSSRLDVNESIIDGCWYYGSFFSPKRNIDLDEHNAVDNGIPSEDEKCQQPIARNKEILKEESSNGDSHSAKISDEDAEKEAECLASMFRTLDEDGDGRVTSDEIVRFLERLSLDMPKEEVEFSVRSASACGNDFLTANEFVEFYRIVFIDKEEEAENVKVEEKAICEAFNVFDQNGDGFISAMELADVLSRLGFVEGKDLSCCESMIESVDYNGDGFVDIHEFRHLITRTSSASHPCLQCVAPV